MAKEHEEFSKILHDKPGLVESIAPGLSMSKFLGDIGETLSHMGAQGSHEVAAALFNGSAFVMYPKAGEQSVEQDLSTFSAHIRRLNGILAASGPGSMVLLDEVVSGTDPREGAAIARAFLEARRLQGEAERALRPQPTATAKEP